MASGVGRGILLVAATTAGAAVAATGVVAVLHTKRPPFSLKASPSSRAAARGRTVKYVITINRKKGFSGRVRLAVTGLPRKVAYRLSRQSRTRATLSVRTTNYTPLGLYRPQVRGRSGKNAVSVRLSLRVRKPGGPPVGFGISGSVTGLTPGGPGAIDLSLHNPYRTLILIKSLTVSVKSITAPRATPALPCTLADFSTRQYSGGYPLWLTPSSTRRLSELGIPPVQQPQETVVPRPVNQDGCQGAKLTLAYNGRAVRG